VPPIECWLLKIKKHLILLPFSPPVGWCHRLIIDILKIKLPRLMQPFALLPLSPPVGKCQRLIVAF